MGLFKKKEYIPVAIPHDQWISLLKEDAEAKGTTATVLEDDALLTDIVPDLATSPKNKWIHHLTVAS